MNKRRQILTSQKSIINISASNREWRKDLPNSILEKLIDSNDLLSIKGMVDSVDINSVDDDDSTFLMRASKHGHSDIVLFFIQRGAFLNEQDKHGWTALMYSCVEGHIQTAEILLAAKADKEIKNNNDETAFSLAYFKGYRKLAKLIHDNDKPVTNLNNPRFKI